MGARGGQKSITLYAQMSVPTTKAEARLALADKEFMNDTISCDTRSLDFILQMAEFTKSEMEAWQKQSGAILAERHFALAVAESPASAAASPDLVAPSNVGADAKMLPSTAAWIADRQKATSDGKLAAFKVISHRQKTHIMPVPVPCDPSKEAEIVSTLNLSANKDACPNCEESGRTCPGLEPPGSAELPTEPRTCASPDTPTLKAVGTSEILAPKVAEKKVFPNKLPSTIEEAQSMLKDEQANPGTYEMYHLEMIKDMADPAPDSPPSTDRKTADGTKKGEWPTNQSEARALLNNESALGKILFADTSLLWDILEMARFDTAEMEKWAAANNYKMTDKRVVRKDDWGHIGQVETHSDGTVSIATGMELPKAEKLEQPKGKEDAIKWLQEGRCHGIGHELSVEVR